MFTFLYTDIERSSYWWEHEAVAIAAYVEEHFRVVAEACKKHDGNLFKSLGDGAACVFEDSANALSAALQIQQALDALSLEPRIRTRIGIHSGKASRTEWDYQGACLNQVSRITSLAHGGQILASATTLALLKDAQLDFLRKSIGTPVLVGMDQEEELFQVWTPNLESDFPPLSGSLRQSGELPTADRVMIGREADADAVCKLLTDSSHRLITIKGFGGVGKSTLAAHCGEVLYEHFEESVFWVNCEGIRHSDQLLVSILTSMGATVTKARLPQQVIEFGKTAKGLLILDCFEGLLHLVSEVLLILSECPGLKVLVTSRVTLESSFETIYELGGLSRTKAKDADWSDAAKLFVSTAENVNPGLIWSRSERKLVNDLVSALDGIPLAIILVASRLRHLGLGQISELVQSNLLSVAAKTHDKVGRHANLSRVIEASFALLDTADQELLASLAVFVGGFTPEAAANVTGDQQVLLGVSRLRDHSLLVSMPGSDARYRELDSVREFVNELQPLDVKRPTEMRHARYFCGKALDLRESFDRREWQAVSKTLKVEGGNFTKAILTSVLSQERELICDLATRLLRPLIESGLTSDFWILVKAAKPLADRELLIEILGLAGIASLRANDFAVGERYWLELYDLAVESNDVELQAETMGDILGGYMIIKNVAKVEQYLPLYQALTPNFEPERAAAHKLLEARCYMFLGRFEKAVAICRSINIELSDARYVLKHLASIFSQAGLPDEALVHARRLLKVSLEGGMVFSVGEALMEVAKIFGPTSTGVLCLETILSLPKHAITKLTGETKQLAKEWGVELKPNKDWQGASRKILDV